MAPDPQAIDDQVVISRLQAEMAALGAFADDCEAKYLLKHRDLVAIQAVVEQLKLERHELLKTIDGHIDTEAARQTELAALHQSVATYREETEKLRECVALMEEAAAADERTASRAQEMAAWEAQQKVLRDQARTNHPVPVIIETALVLVDDFTPIENSSGEAADAGALTGPLEATPPQAMACLAAGDAPESEPLVVRSDEPALEDHPLPAASPPAADDAPRRHGKAPLDPAIDAEVRRVFIIGGSSEDIADAVRALGKQVSAGWAKNRVQKLNLKAADRVTAGPARGYKSKPGQALVVASKSSASPVTPKSRHASMWGSLVAQYDAEHYDADDIADMINKQAARADRMTAQDVRRVLLELKRLKGQGEVV